MNIFIFKFILFSKDKIIKFILQNKTALFSNKDY